MIFVTSGSTPIVGMPAKPILDILVGVQTLAAVEPFVEDLNLIGYEDKGDGDAPARRYFVKGAEEKRTHHLNFCELTGIFWTTRTKLLLIQTGYYRGTDSVHSNASTTGRGRNYESLDSDVLPTRKLVCIVELCDQRATRMLVEIRTEFSVITPP